jgi:hypothetical protein
VYSLAVIPTVRTRSRSKRCGNDRTMRMSARQKASSVALSCSALATRGGYLSHHAPAPLSTRPLLLWRNGVRTPSSSTATSRPTPCLSKQVIERRLESKLFACKRKFLGLR